MLFRSDQQELRDNTYRNENGEGDQQSRQQRQSDLRQRLEELQRRMKGMGMQGEQGLDDAEQAMRDLRVSWKSWPRMPDVSDTEQALRANPATPRELISEGRIDDALHNASPAIERTYLWPYQMHASLGPSCALAHWIDGADAEQPQIRLRVWRSEEHTSELQSH